MGLIKCPKCGTSVSSSLSVCMRCGFPIPKNHINVDENKILNNLNSIDTTINSNNFVNNNSDAIKVDNDTIMIDNSVDKSLEEKVKELEEKLHLTPTNFTNIEAESIFNKKIEVIKENEVKEEPKVEVKEIIKEDKEPEAIETKVTKKDEKEIIKEVNKEINKTNDNYTCLKCGFEFSNDFNFCPKCACPKGVDPEEEQSKLDEEVNNKKEENHKKHVEILEGKKEDSKEKEDKPSKEEKEEIKENSEETNDEVKEEVIEEKNDSKEKEEVKEKKVSKKKNRKDKLDDNELRCPDCEEVFDKSLDACPNCGCPKELVLLDMEMMDDYKEDIKEHNKNYYDDGVEVADEEETTEPEVVEEVEETPEVQEKEKIKEEIKEEVKEETTEEPKEEVKEEEPKTLSREEELQNRIKELEARLYSGNSGITVNIKKVDDDKVIEDKHEEVKEEIKEETTEVTKNNEINEEVSENVESETNIEEFSTNEEIIDINSDLIVCSRCKSKVEGFFKVCPICGNDLTVKQEETNNKNEKFNIKNFVNKIGMEKILVLLIIIVFLILLIVFLTACTNSKITVPDLSGQDEESVKLILEKKGINYKIVSKPSKNVTKGMVITYEPKEIDKESGTVVVYISAGTDKIECSSTISYNDSEDWDYKNPYIQGDYLYLELTVTPKNDMDLVLEDSYISLTNSYDTKVNIEVDGELSLKKDVKSTFTVKVETNKLGTTNPEKLFLVLTSNVNDNKIINKINYNISKCN